MTDTAIFNIRDYFGTHRRAVAAYKSAKIAILANQLCADVIYVKDANFEKYDNLIMAEMPTSLLGGSASFTSPAIDLMLDQIIKLQESGKSFKFYNKQSDEFYQSFMEQLRKRKNESAKLIDFDALENTLLNTTDEVDVPETIAAIVGDSHSAMLWKPGLTLLDMPGKTLHGYLNNPLDLSRFKDITFCLGSIDLQHHLGGRSAADLAERFMTYVTELRLAGHSVTIHAPVPTLPDSHNMRKAYEYHGARFYADYQTRDAARSTFLNGLDSYIDWDSSLYEYNPKQFGVKDIHYRTKYYTPEFRVL